MGFRFFISTSRLGFDSLTALSRDLFVTILTCTTHLMRVTLHVFTDAWFLYTKARHAQGSHLRTHKKECTTNRRR